MKIAIQTPGFTGTPELTGYINEKAEKLSRFYDKIIGCDITLRLDTSHTKENKLCEIRLAIPGNDLIASAQCKTFEEAASKTVEIIKGQIKRKMTKVIETRNDIIADIS